MAFAHRRNCHDDHSLCPHAAPVSPLRPRRRAFATHAAVAELFVGVFRRDLLNFFPQSRFEPVEPNSAFCPHDIKSGPDFQLLEKSVAMGDPLQVAMFGVRYRLSPRCGGRFSAHDRRMIRAIGAVCNMRYHHLFQIAHMSRLELFRGGSEDHYIAAFVEPSAATRRRRAGQAGSPRPS